MPLTALKMRFVVGGSIIKDVFCKLISILRYLLKKLHKEKTTQSVQIEIVASNVLIINVHKD